MTEKSQAESTSKYILELYDGSYGVSCAFLFVQLPSSAASLPPDDGAPVLSGLPVIREQPRATRRPTFTQLHR